MTEKHAARTTLFFKSPAATGLVLLFLICHAFLATTTHFHRDVRPGAAPVTLGLSAGGDEGATQPNVANGHAQCVLCRLQRNFVCDLEQGIPTTLAPLARDTTRAVRAAAIHSRVSFLAPSGRAPPSA